jgi:2',3'-cyclic-nucleotide 2'-phosphodiesterase (5'-nucleotidase family)
VIPPEAVLKKLLPEVRGKADLVVLLSLFDAQKTRALVKATQGVDVAISSGSDDVFYVEPLANTVLLQTGSLGKTLGSMKITLDEKRKLSIGDRQHVPLRSSVPGDEAVERLIEEFRMVEKTKAAALAKKEWDKRHKELTEGLQLSPQEFMERYRKEQIEKGKGESR